MILRNKYILNFLIGIVILLVIVYRQSVHEKNDGTSEISPANPVVYDNVNIAGTNGDSKSVIKSKVKYLKSLDTEQLLDLLKDKKYQAEGYPLITILDIVSKKYKKDEFEQVFRAIYSFPDNRRYVKQFLGQTVVRMSDLGEDAVTLVSRIYDLSQPGDTRNHVLRDLMSQSNFAISENIVSEMLEYTTNKIEEESILNGVRFRISSAESLDDYAALLNTSNAKLRDEVCIGMSSYLTHCKMYIEGTYAARLKEVMSILAASDMELSPSIMNRVIKLAGSEQALEFYDFLNSGTSEATLALNNVDLSFREKMAGKIAEDSPNIACNLFLQKQDVTALAAGLNTWLAKDESAALEWFSKHATSMDVMTLDNAKAAIAISSARKPIAEQWALVNDISDPTIKKKAEGAVWGRELNMVRKTVNADPSKAVNDLITGNSQHDPYWIEEAMDVWMAKDIDDAQKWYQDNWRNLPTDKAQYVAASFAKQAIKTGDADVAAQWIPFIKDPKTKERIENDLKNIYNKN